MNWNSALFKLSFSLIIIPIIFHNRVYSQTSLPDSLVQKRIGIIQKMLDQGKPGANRWWNGWLIGYSAATVVQGAVMLTSHELRTRQDMGAGAVTTFLGAMGQIITPMVPGHAPDRLRAISGGSTDLDIYKLSVAEDLLRKSCLREKSGRSWTTHAVAGVVNAGTGLVVWLGFKRSFLEGLENFAINTAVTEAQIWSQPVRAIKDYDRYNRQFRQGRQASDCRNIIWYVNAFPGGISLHVLF